MAEGADDHNHQQDLKDLHAEVKATGLLEPSHFWRTKLLFWIPAFFLSYYGLLVVHFGLAWLILAPLCAVSLLTMGFVGHDAGDLDNLPDVVTRVTQRALQGHVTLGLVEPAQFVGHGMR